jgi:hypothetical protein
LVVNEKLPEKRESHRWSVGTSRNYLGLARGPENGVCDSSRREEKNLPGFERDRVVVFLWRRGNWREEPGKTPQFRLDSIFLHLYIKCRIIESPL